MLQKLKNSCKKEAEINDYYYYIYEITYSDVHIKVIMAKVQ